jgi:hypothetical protein
MSDTQQTTTQRPVLTLPGGATARPQSSRLPPNTLTAKSLKVTIPLYPDQVGAMTVVEGKQFVAKGRDPGARHR